MPSALDVRKMRDVDAQNPNPSDRRRRQIPFGRMKPDFYDSEDSMVEIPQH